MMNSAQKMADSAQLMLSLILLLGMALYGKLELMMR